MSEASGPWPETCTVAIIGAGLGGLAVAVNLMKRSITDFVVLEQSEGPGGTWWDNRFPGAEVDVTSELYCYSFKPYVFTRSHASQDEILGYVHQVVDEYQIWRKLRLSVAVTNVVWNESEAVYDIRSGDGRRWRARFVVSAVGQLNNPRYPDWPGLEEFEGPCFHTARWDTGLDLTGKKVAVVGTGSTSAQVVPAIAGAVEHLYLFQRQPGWVLPKGDHDYTVKELGRLRRNRLLRKWRRLKAFLMLERMRAVAVSGSRANRRKQRIAEKYIAATIKDPAVRAAVTPDYPFYGKRPVLTQYYYPALNRSNVTVIPRAVSRLTATGVVDDSGAETAVDVVVMATGFQPQRFLATLEVRGREGRSLQEQWGDQPRAFLGLMAAGFPNFFVLYGPNTNGGDVLFTLERQAEWAARAIRRGIGRQADIVEVRPRLVTIADTLVTRRNAKFVWAKTRNNYYTSATGRVVTQWPYTQTLYRLLLRILDSSRACIFTRKVTVADRVVASAAAEPAEAASA